MKRNHRHKLTLAVALLGIVATPAWAAWTYIGPGATSVHLTLPVALSLPATANPLPVTPTTPKQPSLPQLQQQGKLSGVLIHDRQGWNPGQWVPAGQGTFSEALEHLLPGHQVKMHPGLYLPKVSWSAGTAQAALGSIARNSGLLLVVTHHDVYVFAG